MSIKICKLWGENIEGMPLNYPYEIIENHPDNEPIPKDFLILSDEEIQCKIEAHRETVEKIFEKQNRQRVYLATDSFESPLNLDFNILDLHSKEVRFDNSIIINHYKTFNTITFEFSDLAISEEIESFYDSENILRYQKNTIKAYKEKFSDDNENDVFYEQKVIINTKDFV